MIGSTASRPPFPVTLDNWQQAGQIGWTFQHIAEIFPTAVISRGSAPPARLPTSPTALGEVSLLAYDGSTWTVGDVLAITETDGWMFVRDGVVLAEHYGAVAGGAAMEASTRHLLMSVSKSIVGCAVGALVGAGVIEVEAPITYYIPEIATSGYAGATVRNLLDMRSGIRFSENYLNPYAEVRVLEQAFGWAPRRSPDVPGTLRGFLLGLEQAGPHGGPFDYRSCETDVLGWLCEAVTGRHFPELVAELVWSKIGAEFDADIGVDAEGSGMFDGGISAALGDLVRFGMMILNGGSSLTGRPVVSESWIEDSFAGGPDSREAFAAGPGDNRMPGGMYRNQFWFPYPDREVLLCLGIHGQLIYVNRAARTVGVKLSSWPTPQDAWKLFSTVSAFDAISAAVG